MEPLEHSVHSWDSISVSETTRPISLSPVSICPLELASLLAVADVLTQSNKLVIFRIFEFSLYRFSQRIFLCLRF